MRFLEPEARLGKRFCEIGPAAALLGGGALSAFGGIFGSIFGGSSQADAIREAAQLASDTALRMNQRARNDVKPFREMGITAGTTLMGMLTGKTNVSDVLQESPLYQFQRDLGTRDITRQLAARGLQYSGAGMETLGRFTNQLVSEEGQRFYDRLFNVTNLGSNAAAQMANMTNQTGTSLANMQLQAGMAEGQAKGQMYQGIGNTISGIGGTLAQYPMYQASIGMLNRLGGPAQPTVPMSPYGPYSTGYQSDSLSLVGA